MGRNTNSAAVQTVNETSPATEGKTPNPLIEELMWVNRNLSDLAGFSLKCANASMEANGKIRGKCFLSGREVPLTESALHGATVEAINPLLTEEYSSGIDTLCKSLQAGEQVNGEDVANILANLYRVSVLYSASAAFSLVSGSMNAARSAKRSEETAQVQREVEGILKNLSEISESAKTLADSFGK